MSDQDVPECQRSYDLCRLGSAMAAGVVNDGKPQVEAAWISLRAHLPNVQACSLALLCEEGEGLRSMPLVGGDYPSGEALHGGGEPEGHPPAAGKKAGKGTAAWQAFQQLETLVWTSGGGTCMYSDWRELQEQQHSTALVTVPLLYAPNLVAGCATFLLSAEPSKEDVELLEVFAGGLGRHIVHETKGLLEVSLGFLKAYMPPPVLQRMLSVAVTRQLPQGATSPGGRNLPPGSALGAALAGAIAGASGSLHDRRLAAAGKLQGPVADSAELLAGGPLPKVAVAGGQPTGQRQASMAARAVEDPGSAKQQSGAEAFSPTVSQPEAPIGAQAADGKAAGHKDSGSAACLAVEPGPVNPLAFILQDISLKDVPPQKWTLEFSDPRLEEAYKTWFNGRQAVTDLLVFRSYLAMLLLIMLGLLIRGSLSWGATLFCCEVVLSIALPARLVSKRKDWYIHNRSVIVAAVRTTSCITILLHSLCHPELYQDSLLKALCGNCMLSMALNTFRNKLRFMNHMMSQLLKLYLCATINAFIYSDPARASQQFLSLSQTTLAQLVGVVVPSIALYRMEARARRAFVQRRCEIA
ncbi:hypothetical protein N2152v2_006259 [Parachlorella kessleri]